MADAKVSAFEIVLLVVGIAASILGFHLINRTYIADKEVTWLMIIAIFNWLMLLVLFVSLSLTVDISKKQLAQMEKMVEAMESKRRK